MKAREELINHVTKFMFNETDKYVFINLLAKVEIDNKIKGAQDIQAIEQYKNHKS